MKHYRPLLLQELDVRLPGLHIRRLRLNRHLPEVDLLAEHSHAFGQILCYLSGRGILTIEGEDHAAGPGTTVLLPPRSRHGFREAAGRRPLCLVLDLDMRGAVKRGVSIGRLSQSEAAMVRGSLAEITRLPDPCDAGVRLVVAGAVLRILDTMLRGLGVMPPVQRTLPAFVRRFERELLKADEALVSIAAVTARMGYQKDYFNRIFKEATGQTLREYRDALLVARAIRLLRENRRVKDVCDRLGFLDQNYFARWFKKHTGTQPRDESLTQRMGGIGRGVRRG